jgi:hypothetical protein
VRTMWGRMKITNVGSRWPKRDCEGSALANLSRDLDVMRTFDLSSSFHHLDSGSVSHIISHLGFSLSRSELHGAVLITYALDTMCYRG